MQVFDDSQGLRRRRLTRAARLLGATGAAAAALVGLNSGWAGVARVGGWAADGLAAGTLAVALGTAVAITLRSWLVDLLALVRHCTRRGTPDFTPALAVVVPAYNEEATLCDTISGLLASDYPLPFEIVVVDDGSTDCTWALAQAAYGTHPRVRLLRKPNGGKCSALNLGLGHASAEIVVCIDADTLLAPDALRLLCRHFHDPRVGAVAGCPGVGNRHNVLTRLQALEYTAQRGLEREALETLNAISCVSGAIGAYRRELLVALGGYAHDTLAEDNDMTLRILRSGWRVRYEERARAWTEAPEDLRDFHKQRFRWMYGTAQAATKHAGAALAWRGGSFGWLTMPHLLLQTGVAVFLVPLMDAGLVLLAAYLVAAPQVASLLPGSAALLGALESHGGGIAWALGGSLAASWLMAALAVKRTGHEPLTLALWYLPLLVTYRLLLGLLAYRCIAAAVMGRAQGWGFLRRTGAVGRALPQACLQSPDGPGRAARA